MGLRRNITDSFHLIIPLLTQTSSISSSYVCLSFSLFSVVYVGAPYRSSVRFFILLFSLRHLVLQSGFPLFS